MSAPAVAPAAVCPPGNPRRSPAAAGTRPRSLQALALAILLKRSASLSRIAANNPWLVLYMVYCGISILWSDYPFVSFKRWTKDIGNIAMVLVVMTEADPVEAVKTLLRRIAYLAVPLSIVSSSISGISDGSSPAAAK